MKKLGLFEIAGAAALALTVAGAPARAGDQDSAQARKEMQKAQAEVEKAREELQRATQELARSMARVEVNNPRVQYFAYMTDPKRAVLGVLIDDDVKDGEMRGVRLLAVTPGSGADKAGLKAGDLVLSLNGASLAGNAKEKELPPKKLRNVLKTLKAGDSVKAEWERDGKTMNGTIVTTAPEPDLAMAPPPGFLDEWLHDEDFDKYGSAMMGVMPTLQFRGPAIRGLELAKVEDELGSYFKTNEGVLVIKAPKNGSLALKGGDVILKIDGDAVSEPVTVLDKLRSRSDEQTVKLEIMRQGKKTELTGTIPVADAGMPRVYQYQEKRRRVKHGDDDKGSDEGN